MQNLDRINERIKNIFYNVNIQCDKCNRNPKELNIMAVTKTVPVNIINEALLHGIELIGENRVQEFLEKADEYNIKKDGIHFIGYLQTNKVKYIIDRVSMIESVHSVKLAKAIDAAAQNKNIIMDVCLEVNIGQETSKSGFFKAELDEALTHISALKNIRVKGLMCIPPKQSPGHYFQEMQCLFGELKSKNTNGMALEYLSMGMSADYITAIKYGANIIRLGSAIFGERN